MSADGICVGGANSLWCCINDMSGGIPSGTLQNFYLSQPLIFPGLDGFLYQADAVMDRAECPHAVFARRGFVTSKQRNNEEAAEADKKKQPLEPCCETSALFTAIEVYAEFWINVYYRQNGSWQGRRFILEINAPRISCFFAVRWS